MDYEYKKITNKKTLQTLDFADNILGEVGNYKDDLGRRITRVAYVKDGKKVIAAISSENMNKI